MLTFKDPPRFSPTRRRPTWRRVSAYQVVRKSYRHEQQGPIMVERYGWLRSAPSQPHLPIPQGLPQSPAALLVAANAHTGRVCGSGSTDNARVSAVIRFQETQNTSEPRRSPGRGSNEGPQEPVNRCVTQLPQAQPATQEWTRRSARTWYSGIVPGNHPSGRTVHRRELKPAPVELFVKDPRR
jgi:hypothetical protein